MRAFGTTFRMYSTLLALVLLPLAATVATAFPGGIVGRTLAPSCGACHGPAGSATTVTMSSANGSFTTSPGGTITVAMVVAHASKVAAGVNVAATDIGGLNAGTLSVDNNSGLRISLGEITHSAPKLLVNGSATFTFVWTAPTTPGSYYLRGSGNAVDNTGGSDNDQFNYLQNGPIYLNVSGQVGAPSALLPTTGTLSVPTTATLAWEAVSGAIAFDYQVSTTSGFTAISTAGTVWGTSAVVVSNLRTGTVYYWRVRSLSVLSTSAYVASSFATVSGPPTSLAMPVIITPLSNATGVATVATLIWSTIPEALQYDFQVSTRSNYSLLTTSGTISLTTATISGLKYNTLYYWRVRSRYGTVVSGYRTASFTTVAGQPPRAVSPVLHAINIPSTAAVISWSSLPDAAGYNYQVSTESTFSVLMLNANTTSTTASLPVLQKNSQYFWRVRAYGTAMGTTPFTTANFVTEVPKAAKKIVITNAPDFTPKSFVPFSVMIRTADAAGRPANVTRATLLAFAEDSPMLSVVGVTRVVLDMGQHVTTLSLVMRNATSLNVTALLTTATVTTAAATSAVPAATSQTITISPLAELDRVVHIAPASSATAISGTTATAIVWRSVEGATAYTLQVSTSADFSSIANNVLLNVDNPFATTATTSLQFSGPARYWWRVQASNIVVNSEWSDAWDFIAGARFLAPVLLSPSNGAMVAEQASSLVWQRTGEPSSYRVQVSTTASFDNLHTEVTTANLHASVAALVPATGYYWRVKAVDGTEESAWSSAWNFQTRPILVVYPSGGEWLLARASTSITWTSGGASIDQVRIEYAANGSWQTLTTATQNTGSYAWTVPYVTTTQALVRITDIANTTASATSDDYFNIAPAAPLHVTVLLEGAYVSSGTMATTLYSAGYIPLADPYTEQTVATSIPAGTTDWVQLEFRPVSSPATPGETQSLLLRNDGRITAPDGSTSEVVDISRIPPGDYRLVVRHRNHLPVISASPFTLSATGAQPLDLSVSAAVHSQFGNAVKEVEAGRYAMIAGDVVVDGGIGAPDRVAVRNATGQTGYTAADVALDGIVGAADRIAVMNNRFAVSQVPW